MHTTRIMILAVVGLAAASFARPVIAEEHGEGTARLQLVEATVSQLQHAIQTKLITPEQLVDMYLARIAAYDKAGPSVNAFLFLNPNAEAQARALGGNGENEGRGDDEHSRPLLDSTRTASRCATSKAREATGTTAPTTWPWTPRCWPARCPAAR